MFYRKQAGTGPSQNVKVLVNWGPFYENASQCRKKTEMEDPLGFFNIHFVAKLEKKLEGGKIFIFGKKVSQWRKNWKGGPFSLAR